MVEPFNAARKGVNYMFLFIFLVFLGRMIYLSYKNADKSFVEENPKLFLTENIVAGLAFALPMGYMAMNRGLGLEDTMALVIAIFTVFYVLNVLYEFSKDGLNVDFTSSTTRKWITGIVVSIIVLASLVVHDFSPDFGKIGIETFLLAISVLMLKYYKARNRSEKVDAKDMIYTFLIVMGSSLILQSGGIYTHLSMKPFDEVPLQM
jgi:hypothetical protein